MSHVTDFRATFQNCDKFDQDLGNWNVERGRDFSRMFHNACDFSGKGLEHWRPLNARTFHGMFENARSLDADLLRGPFPIAKISRGCSQAAAISFQT